MEDPKCAPTLDNCAQKCGTKGPCWSFCLAGGKSHAAVEVAKCAQKNHCDKSGDEEVESRQILKGVMNLSKGKVLHMVRID